VKKTFKGVIFDVNGVLEFQGEIYPGAVETVNRLKERGIVVRILTNSTLESRASCAEKLRQRGFWLAPEEVITASSATATYLEGLKPRSCWVMLEREGLDEFKIFQHDTENPEYVVVGDNRSEFDFEHLNKALRLLQKGAKLIGMQSDLVDTSLGESELNVGSWVGMLERAAGVQATYVGKPNPFVFELTLKTMGLDKSDVVMVGDRVASDVVGARNFGIKSILLRTGEFDERDLTGEIEPDFIFDSLQDVLKIF
jgi:NagD protein